ncbi:MAG: YbaK/EbsC family protein [Candidatus Dojkabacteria bacterium]|nr:MAG: YbaK/EbsC family protein [Candidatus Dojkabacteria bacterium]
MKQMAVTTFKQYLEANDIDVEIIETSEDTHTAQQAADVHGVPVSNIVKSLLLCADEKQFYLVLTPGDVRLDIEKWKERLGATTLRMANADEVKQNTGYSIGGVPPFGHATQITTYIEEGFDPAIDLVAAAGSAKSVFKITLAKLNEVIS